MHALFKMKSTYLQRAANLYPEPFSALIGGITVGARRGIPESILQTFQRAGITHILALSGYNVTVIASMTLTTLLAIGLNRRHAFWGVVVLLVLFCLLTGAPASVVRAVTMGILVLLARRLGRGYRIGYALLFAATVMTILNPRVLLYDAGFHLSFLATLGLVYLAPRLSAMFHWLPTTLGVQEAAISTTAATLATLPVLVLQFGRLSIVSVAVNISILPLLPFITIAGIISVLVPFLGNLLALFVWLALSYVLMVASWFASLPFASFPLSGTAAVVLVVLALALVSWFLFRRTRSEASSHATS